MKRFSLALAVATIIGGVTAASAQNYPSRPITAIVSFAAGGSGDTILRIVAEHMRKYARPDDRRRERRRRRRQHRRRRGSPVRRPTATR